MKHAEGRVSEQTQRFVLRVIYDYERWTGVNATQAANLMDMPQATINRAFDELTAIEPAWVNTENMIRRFYPGPSKKDFLQKASYHLFNPVVREYRLERIPATRRALPLSGISAVSHYSSLEDRPFPTFAISKGQESELGLREGRWLADWDSWEEPACVMQVMRYELDSILETAIDPVSAILSLTDEEMGNPSIERAAKEVIKAVFGR